MFESTRKIALLILFSCWLLPAGAAPNKDADQRQFGTEPIVWDNSLSLPALHGVPAIGVAGAFSGFVGDYLVVGGGANFPEALPWEGGSKKWWQTLYSIHTTSEHPQWQLAAQGLPRPLAYGVTIGLPEGMLCIGGCDERQCYADVFLIHQQKEGLAVASDWPSLPVPLANAAGARVGNSIYIAGGQEGMEQQEATAHFYKLDLQNRKKGWQELPAWPGTARGYAVGVAQSDGFDLCFYLFSGRNYNAKGEIEILQDGFVYNPRLNSWKSLKGQFPVMAGTALATGANHILFLGGASTLIPGSDQHPGFDNRVRLYHTITQTLIEKEVAPYSIPVTTTVARKGNRFYLGSGEVKPGIRTPHLLRGEIQSFERGLGFWNTIVIFLYFASLAWIGYYFSKKQKSTDDYFKGGGRIPWWVVGLSIFGTGLSAITFMAIPAKAFATDWSYMMLNSGILMVVPVVLYLFIPFYRRLNITTAYEYLELRFNPLIRVLCSLAFILFQVGRMGVVLFLPAIALNVVTGFDIFLCIALMGVLSLIYTMIGGIEAVIWTDALQVIVLLGGALLVLGMAIYEIPGGWNTVVDQAVADQKLHLGSWNVDWKQSTIWTVLVATFFTNLTIYGTDQTFVQRYMTTETAAKAKKSIWTNAFLTIPATLIFFTLGTVLYVYYKQYPQELSITISEGDSILPWYIFSQLPQGVVGLLISGIFAAAMSTLSSSMNSAATAYIVDIHRKTDLSKRTDELRSAQIATFVIGIIGILFAFLMATWNIESLWDEFNRILGLILGSFGGLFLLGMLTQRANSIGALSGIIGSILVQVVVMSGQTVHLLLYTTVGFVSCFVIGYIVSWLTPVDKKSVVSLTVYGILFTKKINK